MDLHKGVLPHPPFGYGTKVITVAAIGYASIKNVIGTSLSKPHIFFCIIRSTAHVHVLFSMSEWDHSWCHPIRGSDS